jgi:hypothetical protein
LTEEQKAQARANIGVDGSTGGSGYKLIETITLEEETNLVNVDFDKKYKSIRVRIVFPSATTAIGYAYSKVKVDGYAYPTNMCGVDLATGTLYVDHIRSASDVSPLALFAPATGHGNERAEPLKMCFPNPTQVGFSEKDGYKGIQISTYGISFSAGTVIHIMEG